MLGYCRIRNEIGFFVFYIWDLWNHRNALIRGENSRTAQEVIYFVHKYNVDFRRAQASTRSNLGTPPPVVLRSLARWQPPPLGCLKINCDAALDLPACKAGVGVVIRDHLGGVVECAALKTQAMDFVSNLEAMAIF